MSSVLRLGLLLRAFVFATCASACEPRTAPPQRPQAATQPMRRVPLGLCEDYPEESRSLDEARRDFELLRQSGTGVLRVSMGWDELEPQKDRYHFEFWDAFVDMAVREYHLTLIPYVAYTPEWNSDGKPQDFWKTPPRDVNEFGELLGLLAARYHGRINSWELWNEPDNRDYWLGSEADYARLVDAGAHGVHAAAPDVKVVFGGLAGGVDFLRTLFDQYGAAESVDVVNLHSYYETWNPAPIETIPEYVADVEKIIERHGRAQSIWMAEVGYSDFRAPTTGTMPPFSYEHTLGFQAVMLTRTLALALSQPAVSLFAWYELKDPRPTDAVIGDAHNRHLGVAFADYRPKPALAALTFANQLFLPGFRAIDAEMTKALPSGSQAEVHAFLTARGSVVIIAWLRTHDEGPAPAQRGDIDTRSELVRVSLPYSTKSQAQRFDETGRLQGPVPTRTNARGVELNLDLRAGAVQIVELSLVSDSTAL